jgi:cobalamin-dependent methionine synthase I
LLKIIPEKSIVALTVAESEEPNTIGLVMLEATRIINMEIPKVETNDLLSNLGFELSILYLNPIKILEAQHALNIL